MRVQLTSSQDLQDIDDATRELQEHLREMNEVFSVEEVTSSSLPHGAKGLDVLFGSLWVQLVEIGGIATVINVFNAWTSRNKDRSVEIQIGDNILKLNGISHEEQQELIEFFKNHIQSDIEN